MPAGQHRINMLLRAAAMLFAREGQLRIDGFADRQSRRPKRNCRGIIGPIPPRQFGLDPARHRLAERTAEIERPQAVRHHFGRNAVKAKSIP